MFTQEPTNPCADVWDLKRRRTLLEPDVLVTYYRRMFSPRNQTPCEEVLRARGLVLVRIDRARASVDSVDVQHALLAHVAQAGLRANRRGTRVVVGGPGARSKLRSRQTVIRNLNSEGF